MNRGLPIRTPALPAGMAWLCLAAIMGCLGDRGTDSPGPTRLPTEVTGLEAAARASEIHLATGDTLVLDAAPVKMEFLGTEVRMLAYNGSIPGPTLRVRQGAEIVVRLRNHTGLPTTLHAHGVRMDYRFDGVANTSQAPIPHGGEFTYRLRFPDAGLFWYHAHEREDYSLELGLYGNFLVEPVDSAYWRPVDREQILMLDDFYLDTALKAAPFRIDGADRTMMGRFGNVFLVNGETAFRMDAKQDEVVRFYATNSANTRVFHIGIADTGRESVPLKIVGTDMGPYQYHDTSSSTLVAPGERKIVEAHFERPGTYYLTHHILKTVFNPDTTIILGLIQVAADAARAGRGARFFADDSSLHTLRSVDSLRTYLDPGRPPDKRLLLTGTMIQPPALGKKAGNAEPISIEAKGVEWTDHMSAMNAYSDTRNMRWVIRDMETGRENHAIAWRFPRDAKVRIRIQNDTAATHPMPHPIHFHGQRFLVAAVNGRRNLNMAWKDTYLVGVRETVDILLDAGNPGEWMAHCHIAEHVEDSMMFHFTVE